MINWETTEKEFGYRSKNDLIGKRPKVVSQCDTCQKAAVITVRVRSKVDESGQMPWKCPSCVGKQRSGEISEQMRRQWRTAEYRRFNEKYRSDQDYIDNQASKARGRWQDGRYRQKIATGIDVHAFIAISRHLYGNRFDYSGTKFGTWQDRIDIKCSDCGTVLSKSPQKHIENGHCDNCGGSKGQREITDYVRSLGHSCLVDDQTAIKPYELDIYLPEEHLAIEYHGIFWHSYGARETYQQKYKHQLKALACRSKGIKLLQFFEFEWAEKNHIVRSMIAHSLGVSRRVDARRLKIDVMDSGDAVRFFEANHLHGGRHARINIGLMDDSGIAAAISFNKHLDGYEIIRFASRAGCCVRGGLGRLLTHFRRQNGGPIYTFADMRFSTAESYTGLGFRVLHSTGPNYFYCRGGSILSRQRCQKSKLGRLLEKFDGALSESENMFANRYRRCWDAGNIKLVMK